jgi:AcrR family transcriptional regulator
MRINAHEKLATRQRILFAAEDLFRRHSFEAATTREIAQAAGIAAGTLFNYFPSKEAIVAGLAEDAWANARTRFQDTPPTSDLNEALFALIAAELRELKPLRGCLAPLFDTVLSPLARTSGDSAPDAVRREHLELVADLVRQHRVGELPPLALQLYWTLYLGVLTFWSKDPSPHQEDTLALLDQSLEMFVQWLISVSVPSPAASVGEG